MSQFPIVVHQRKGELSSLLPASSASLLIYAVAILACENIRFSSLFIAWDVSRGGKVKRSWNALCIQISSLVFGLRWAQRNHVLWHLKPFSAGLPVKVFKTLNGRQFYILSKFHKIERFQLILTIICRFRKVKRSWNPVQMVIIFRC